MTQLLETDRIIAEADDLVQFERDGIVYAYFPATDTAVPWERYADERRHQRSRAGVAAWRQLVSGINDQQAAHAAAQARMWRATDRRITRVARTAPVLGAFGGAMLAFVAERLIG